MYRGVAKTRLLSFLLLNIIGRSFIGDAHEGFFVTMQQLFKKVQKQKLFDLNINILFTTFELPKYKS
jgi:hypothetical protein